MLRRSSRLVSGATALILAAALSLVWALGASATPSRSAPPTAVLGTTSRTTTLAQAPPGLRAAVQPADPTQEATLTGRTEGDVFGYSVAVSGNTAVVGALGAVSTLGNYYGPTGAAYVFTHSGVTWTQQARLLGSDTTFFEQFGYSVAISGNTVVVGVPSKRDHAGAAYVFTRSGTTWNEQAKLTAYDGVGGDDFGHSVAISENTVVVGAPGKRDGTGAAYVFTRSGTTWTRQSELTASAGVSGDGFGWSVAVSGNTALVGADGRRSFTGAAYVFTRSGTIWTRHNEFTALDGASGDAFGFSVAVSGGTAVVGAPGKRSYTGAAYLFTQSGTTWTRHPELTAAHGATGDAFGLSVAVSETTAVVGAPIKNISAGAAYVFTPSGTTWAQRAELTASPAASGNVLGFSVAVSGTTAVAGAPYRNLNIGAAYMFAVVANHAPTITSTAATTFTVGAHGSFTVTTSGFPTPTLSHTGALPAGVTFTNHGNGTATIAGTPAAGTASVYHLTITAQNGVSPAATQTFTLTVNHAPQAPAITSGAETSFAVGVHGSFTVTTSGVPTPSLSHTGALPAGVTFTNHGNGTATIAGTAAAGSEGPHRITITAQNGVSPAATQTFTLTVHPPQAPVITSAASTIFTAGVHGSFTVTAGGFPTPTLIHTGALPAGVTFTHHNGNGTATIVGTPATGTGGLHHLTITAQNGVSPAANQTFTLTVHHAPAITSRASTIFREGVHGSFTVTTSGLPIPSLSHSGTLPAWATFTPHGNGTATIAGTPPAGTTGTEHHLTITANNGLSPAATQAFTLTVGAPPRITSAASTTFTRGVHGSFTVTTTGVPIPLMVLFVHGALPAGVTFTNNWNGTATIAGDPEPGTAACDDHCDYHLTIIADNGVSPEATQEFTLTVNRAPDQGGLVPLPPARVLDTRTGIGGFRGPVHSGQTISLPVLGQGGVPTSGVAAVVLNVTAVQPTGAGFLTVYPSGAARHETSNLNFVAHQTVPNLVIAPVGAQGKVEFHNGSSGTVQILADVSGWFISGRPAAGGLEPVTPARVLDTRTGIGASAGPVHSGQTISLHVLGRDGVPTHGVGAVVLNVTAVQPTGAGFLTVYPSGGPRHDTSNLNFVAGQTVPNLVIAPVGADGRVAFHNGSSGTVQILADVSGWFAAGHPTYGTGGLGPLTPARVLDTRTGLGGIDGPLYSGQTRYLTVLGQGGVPYAVGAVVLNVTVVQPTGAGFLTVYPLGEHQPTTSNLNFVAHQTVPNLVIAPVGYGVIAFHNGSAGAVQILADVSGWFAVPPFNPLRRAQRHYRSPPRANAASISP